MPQLFLLVAEMSSSHLFLFFFNFRFTGIEKLESAAQLKNKTKKPQSG